MLAKKNRITQKNEFDLLYKKGSSLKFEYLKISFLPNQLAHNRLAVVISKKVSAKANQRNYLKRKLKSLFFNNLNNKGLFYDILITGFKNIEKLKNLDILTIVNTLNNKL
ncbi:MAG: ribonuclease P protein component [Candidatus Moraniibacteriota bacterium]